MEALPGKIEASRRSLERALGRPVHIRGVRTPDPQFRGRLRVERHRVLIEYQPAEHGFFWHIPIIEELLSRAAAGEASAELRDASPPAAAERPEL